MELSFGSGSAWGIPSGSNPTPSRLGVMQEIGIDFSRGSKPLFGLNQLPVAVGVSTMQIKGSSTLAKFSGRMFNDLFFGGTSNAGQTIAIVNEGPNAIPTTPFQITVVQSSTWTTDLGVINSATGVPMTRVASSPAAGQYSCAAGVYTFASADNVSGISVKISYLYTTTGGQTLTISNQPVGVGSTFKGVVSTNFNGLSSAWTLNACVATKVGFKTALEDFAKPSFEFDAYADATDTLGTVSFAETN